ncbi:MAG: thymidylate synthase [Oscillospiraceae bacterium]|jgi:thymidylate synthase|nr:thymidylate synthase [Oscillospiraceae bacterium]
MRESFIRGKTLPEAYHAALSELNEHGEITDCPDWGQKQKELSMTFCAEEPLGEPMVSKLYIGGFHELQQYVMEVLDGILDFKIGDGNCWEYTYHDRLVNYGGFNQLAFIEDELRRNAYSRRAVAIIRDNAVDPFNADPACLQHIQFFLRSGKLHCKVLMRSNDAAEATFMNAFAFIMLQRSIAGKLGAQTGTYTHRANSFHCYEKDFALLESYAAAIKGKPIEDITYNYAEYYKDLMEECIPAIQKQVSALRENMTPRA